MSTETVHRSYRIPVPIADRIRRLGEVLKRTRPTWIPPTCHLTETDVVALALDRGLTLLEGSIRDGKEGGG